MSYRDPLEVIEALGIDPIFGHREWTDDGLHVSDLSELARGLCLAQHQRVSWDHDAIKGDPFKSYFDAFASELMIEPIGTGAAFELTPSFRSWKLDASYTAHKIADIVNAVLNMEPPQREAIVRDRSEELGEYHVAISSKTLARIPSRYVYRSHQQVRGDLMRYIVEAANNFILSSMYSFRGSTRDLHHELINAVDALWGFDGLFD
ncbi:MAG: hypothetical protein VYE40_07355 [Myxococcota bacterium]|jgi:hypothetical protein|nr:hypothetical protein [Myxococcota bacterium]